MKREEYIEFATALKNNYTIDFDKLPEFCDMAISALKDIEKIQIIVDAYFTRGSKSGYECMVEIDRFLEPYKKGDKE